MKKVEYIDELSATDFLRVHFFENRGRIAEFIVQYYAVIEDRWRTVFRVDNCHGSNPHQHRYYLHGPPRRSELEGTNEELLTDAILTAQTQWRVIRENYLTTT